MSFKVYIRQEVLMFLGKKHIKKEIPLYMCSYVRLDGDMGLPIYNTLVFTQ